MTRARSHLPDPAAAAVIFFFAFFLRLVFLRQLGNSPFVSHFGVDPEFYKTLALKIARGELFPDGIFWFHSFYVYFLALWFKLLGPDVPAVRVVQSLIGSASCVLLYVIGKRIFGRGVGLLAGLGMATYGFLIFNEFTLESAFLSVFFCLGSLALLQGYERQKKAGPVLFAAGLVSGLFMLSRANTMPFLVLLWIVFREGLPQAKKNITHGLLFLAGILTALLPFSLAIYSQTGHFSFVGGHGGINFFIGNSPYTDGIHANIPYILSNPKGEHDGYMELASQLSGRKMDYYQASSYLFAWTLRYILENPAAYILLLLKKLFLFFRAYEFPDNVMNYYFVKEHYAPILRMLPLELGAVLPLGITGMVLAVRERKQQISLLFLYAGGYLLFMVQFFVLGRLRLPIIPIFILFSAYAVGWMAGLLRENRPKDLGSMLKVAAVLFLVCNWGVVKDRDYEDQYYNLGVLTGDEKYFLEVLKRDPGHLPALENLGSLYLKKGDYDRAETYYDRARSCPNASTAVWMEWARLMERKKDRVSAAQGYRKVLEIDPSFAEAKTRLENLSPR